VPVLAKAVCFINKMLTNIANLAGI